MANPTGRLRGVAACGVRARRPSVVVRWAVLAAACVAPARLVAQQARAPEILEIVFEGGASLDRDVLEAAIATKASGCRSPLFFLPCLIGDFSWAEDRRLLEDTAQVRLDAERLETLYRLWGHPDARVEFAIDGRAGGDVGVRFIIEEGEPVRVAALDIRGLDAFTPPIELPQPLPLREGDPYALPRLDALVDVIERALAERGHPYADVDIGGAVDEPGRAAVLTLDVAPGPAAVFGAVAVEAEPPIEAAVVRSRLAYRAGQPFRPSAIEASERNLYDLPIVERVATDLEGLVARDTVIATRVHVDSRRRSGVEVEGTVSSTDCLELAAFWRTRYVLGAPRVLAIGGGFSNLLAKQADGSFPCSSTGEGEFAEPSHMLEAEIREIGWLGDPRLTLVLRGFTRRESSPNAYIARGEGGSVQVARAVGRRLSVVAGWHPRRQRLEAAAAYFCGNYGVCTGEGAAQLSRAHWLAPAELLAAWSSAERSGGLRRPQSGPGTEWQPDLVPDWRWVLRVGVEAGGAATGSDYRFTRTLAEASATRVLGRSIEIAARVRGGALTGESVLPPQLRLYSGGVSTVRGLEENLLGPRVLVARAGRLPEPCMVDGCGDALVDPARVSVRPIGGDRVAEASIEGRLWLGDAMQIAAFVDWGRLWRTDEDGLAELAAAVGAGSRVTPGIGLRLVTDLGPIRVDIGYDASAPETLPLLVVEEGGSVRVAGDARFSPFEYGSPGGFREFVRRLQLHVAIGQAF